MRNLKLNSACKFGTVIACVLIAAAPAPAFYWTIRNTPTLIPPNSNPGNPPTPGAEPIPIPPDNPVPGGGPGSPGGHSGPPGGPESVPEPATAAAGIVGLIALGARRLICSRR